MKPHGIVLLLLALAACQGVAGPTGGGEGGPGDPGGPGSPGPPSPAPHPVLAADTAASPAAAPWKGETLRVERFQDGELSARGWYDGPRGVLVEGGPPASGPRARSWLCRLPRGATVCQGGTPGRLELPHSPALYLSWHVRYDPGWVGSGRPYHPHELHLLTTADDRFVGPARTHLTVYLEQNAGRPFMAVQDNRNIDPACILRNDDTVVGCAGGPVEAYPFGQGGEARSVSTCNGLVGEVDGRDCYPSGGGWSGYRSWHAPRAVFRELPPPGSDGWRQVEAVVILNTIQDGRGVPDGRIRLWVDGELLVASDRILFRTGEHPDMRFQHLLLAPYIGDGSPVDQQLRITNLVVARARAS